MSDLQVINAKLTFWHTSLHALWNKGNTMTVKMMIATAGLMSASLITPASAATITSLPNGTSVDIPAVEKLNDAGPETFGPGIVFTSTVGSAFGYTGGYGFINNGFWSDTLMIGLDCSTGSFTLTFNSAISGFLVDVNWSSSFAENATMQAFDASGTMIDELVLESGSNLVSPGFHGFSQTGNNISSIRFSNEYIGIRNISIAAAVPEPATWAMMLLGFGMIAGVARYRRRSAKVSFA